MKDYLGDIICIIVIILLCVAFCFGVYSSTTKHDEKLWNNGRCDVCGGTWKYEQAVGHRYATSYIYVCEDCGKRIEISEIRE